MLALLSRCADAKCPELAQEVSATTRRAMAKHRPVSFGWAVGGVRMEWNEPFKNQGRFAK
jgi:hypothetical protein